ncbi:MAG: hypothetical protein AJITA_00524 [Acetilactobacillus jinshanensis]
MKKYYVILNYKKSGSKVTSLTYFSKTKHGFKTYTDPTAMIIGMDNRDHAFSEGDVTNLKRWIKQHPTEAKYSVDDLHVMSTDDFKKKFNQ